MPKGMRGQAKKHRYGAKQKVTGDVLERTQKRAKRLGVTLKGPVTGAKARGIKRAAAARKDKRSTYIGRSFINRVTSGPGSQRAGKGGQVAYDATKGRFVHEYQGKGGKPGKRVPLSEATAKAYGYKKPGFLNQAKKRKPRPTSGRSRQSGGARYTS